MTGRVFITNRPGYGLSCQQDLNLRLSGVYVVRSHQEARGPSHVAILLPYKYWRLPAIVTTGRVFHHQPSSVDFLVNRVLIARP